MYIFFNIPLATRIKYIPTETTHFIIMQKKKRKEQNEKCISFPRKNYSEKAFVRRYFFPATVYLNIYSSSLFVRTELVNPVLRGETPGGRRTFVRGEYRAALRCAMQLHLAMQRSTVQRNTAQRNERREDVVASNRYVGASDRARARERERGGGGREGRKKGTLCPAIHTLHTHEAYPRPSPRPYRPMTGMRSFY